MVGDGQGKSSISKDLPIASQKKDYKKLLLCFEQTKRDYFQEVARGRTGLIHPNGSKDVVASINIFNKDEKFYTVDSNKVYVTPSTSGRKTTVVNTLHFTERNKKYFASLTEEEKKERFGTVAVLDKQGNDKIFDDNENEANEITGAKTALGLTIIKETDATSSLEDLNKALEILHKEIERRFSKAIEVVQGIVKQEQESKLFNTPFLRRIHLNRLAQVFCTCEQAEVNKQALTDAKLKLVNSDIRTDLGTDEKTGVKIKMEDLGCKK